MERLWVLCSCLLLLGVLVNIECSGNHTDPSVSNSTTFNSTSASGNGTTGMNSTVPVPKADTGNSTALPPSGNTTEQNSSATNSTIPKTSPAPPMTPRPSTPPAKTSSAPPPPTTNKPIWTSRPPTRSSTKERPEKKGGTGSSKAGYIVLVFIILIAIILTAFCCLRQNKSRRYSVDLHNKHEDAVIPLSTVEADAVFDASPEKDMETFTALEENAASPDAAPPDPKPAVDPGAKNGEAAAGGEKAAEAAKGTGSQDPLTSEKKPEKMETVDLNEGEPDISTKTSMESLEDQLNDNNSNNYCTRANGIVFKDGLSDILQSAPF